MSTEDNKAVVQSYFDARTAGDPAACDEIFASEFIRNTVDGSYTSGPDDAKDVIVRWRTAFSDYQDTVISLVADGDMVAAHILFTGTHDGVFEFAGRGPWAPTNKSIRIWEFFVYRLRNRKIVEASAGWDWQRLINQLGIDEAVS
jgi:predicted ester cyclase